MKKKEADNALTHERNKNNFKRRQQADLRERSSNTTLFRAIRNSQSTNAAAFNAQVQIMQNIKDMMAKQS